MTTFFTRSMLQIKYTPLLLLKISAKDIPRDMSWVIYKNNKK